MDNIDCIYRRFQHTDKSDIKAASILQSLHIPIFAISY